MYYGSAGTRMRGTRTTERGAISKEGMAAIAFGLTVLMIAITGGLLMQTSGSLSDGGPILTAETEPVDAANGPEGQWVRVVHDSGSAVAVSNLSINVSLPDHRMRARLHGLPTDDLRQSDYDGNHIFTLGPDGIDGAAVANGTDGRWSAAEAIAFRIEDRRADLEPGDLVRIVIRDVVEGKTLYENEVEVS